VQLLSDIGALPSLPVHITVRVRYLTGTPQAVGQLAKAPADQLYVTGAHASVAEQFLLVSGFAKSVEQFVADAATLPSLSTTQVTVRSSVILGEPQAVGQSAKASADQLCVTGAHASQVFVSGIFSSVQKVSDVAALPSLPMQLTVRDSVLSLVLQLIGQSGKSSADQLYVTTGHASVAAQVLLISGFASVQFVSDATLLSLARQVTVRERVLLAEPHVEGQSANASMDQLYVKHASVVEQFFVDGSFASVQLVSDAATLPSLSTQVTVRSSVLWVKPQAVGQ
jgi:hypothetical protein